MVLNLGRGVVYVATASLSPEYHHRNALGCQHCTTAGAQYHVQYLTKVSTPLTFLEILCYIFLWNHIKVKCKVVSVQLV